MEPGHLCHLPFGDESGPGRHVSLSLFYEPLIIVTDLYVNSVCLTIPHTSKQHLLRDVFVLLFPWNAGFGSAGVWSPLSL